MSMQWEDQDYGRQLKETRNMKNILIEEEKAGAIDTILVSSEDSAVEILKYMLDNYWDGAHEFGFSSSLAIVQDRYYFNTCVDDKIKYYQCTVIES